MEGPIVNEKKKADEIRGYLTTLRQTWNKLLNPITKPLAAITKPLVECAIVLVLVIVHFNVLQNVLVLIDDTILMLQSLLLFKFKCIVLF